MDDEGRQSWHISREESNTIDAKSGPTSPVLDAPASKLSASLMESKYSNNLDIAALDDIERNPSTDSDNLTLPPIEPVSVSIRDLSVEVDISPSPLETVLSIFSHRKTADCEAQEYTKSILKDVSADLPQGSLTAIIGGSGSGKTSFLNTVAERMSSGRLKIGGITTFNGRKGMGNVRCAYVMQQDVLLPMLTIRETLIYSADLRLAGMTREQRREAVDAVILELGLKECADTRVGNSVHKGCSGGEKRRCSIAVQLLSNPSVLFLDEPTTGLDATSAYQLVRTLKGLARKDRTIITTIHQPRSEIWGLFDQYVILARGSPVWSGPAAECLPYFSQHGYDLPAFVNPAEFLIDIAAIDNRSPELEATSKERVDRLKLAWVLQSQQSFGPVASQEEFEVSEKRRTWNGISTRNGIAVSKKSIGFFRQLWVLTSRTLKVTYRDPMGMSGCIIEAILMGLVTGIIYFRLSEDQAGIRSREGALYTACALQGYLILLFETYRLSMDVEMFDREHGEGVVDVLPWLLSRRLARLLTEDVAVPLLYSIIFYFLAGFRADAAQFLIFFSVVLLTQYVAVCFATTCIAVTRSFAGASLIANLGYTIQSMACGFFIQSNTIPIYVRWFKWTAYVFYAFGALCSNEFQDHFYDCPFEGGPTNPQCENYQGSFIIASLGLPQNWIARPIIILLAYVVMFYTIAAFTFKYWTVGMTIAQPRHSDTDYSAGKEKLTARSIQDVRAINISLDKFSLQLDKKRALGIGKKIPTKTILEPVSAQFQAGVLNVIMGPSGSGKTSLLNAMALRNHGNLTTKYRQAGNMTFNGAEPSDSVVRSVVSYVCQDDDALLPSLTVRETLRFSAGLRLPGFMSKEEKNQKAEEVLMKMGLKDCADNLIGGELVKGISGGEKRRVTIAVQILTDPRVLLLDEPTSGLDAFTASSIMSVLSGLAAEGRTLIMTIHQSRSDLFPSFGNVLLLARGGSPVYSGPAPSMLAHFSALGYNCPRTTNPADFALDLITVNLQHSTREAESRAKVHSLITSWNGMEGSHIQKSTSIATPAELGALKRKMAPFHISYPILVHRASINLSRQPDLIIARIMQVVGFSIVLALFFAPMKFNYFAVQNRVGFIQEFCAFYFVGMLQNLAVYPAERNVFYREDDDRAYSVEGFLMQYVTLEVPFEIFTSIIFAIFVDLAAGLPRTAQVFWVCFFNCFCIVSCGESVGIMFNTLFRHSGFAVNITSVFLSIAQLMSGIMSINMPTFLKDINFISPIRYAMRNVAPYTLQSIVFTCVGPGEARNADGSCVIGSGEQVLELYDLKGDAVVNLVGLGVATLVYRLLAYGLLKFVRRK